MVTYEELASMKVIGPKAVQIKELLKEKPMNVEELAGKLRISKAAVRPYLRELTHKDEDIGKVRIGRTVHYFIKSMLETVRER